MHEISFLIAYAQMSLILVRVFIYTYTFCVRAVKAQASLCLCTYSTEPSLLDNAIRFNFIYLFFLVSTKIELCGISKNGLIEIHKMTEHARESVLLIAYASTEGSHEPLHPHSLTTNLAAST